MRPGATKDSAPGVGQQRPDSTLTDSQIAATATIDGVGGVAPAICDAGTRVGRYLIVEPLGEGGMGTVYRAFDPELNRDIALKRQRVRGRDEYSRDRLRRRLLREAQSLAQLAHPNVVAVHDVITHGDDVFIAMELVEGRTLSEVVRRDALSPSQILTLFIAAGRGLAAAHATGLVHRDFKPHNVMVGADGRVCVLDFGLAKSVRDAASSTSSDAEGSPAATGDELSPARPTALEVSLTRTGSALGTPGYMAPEQLAGQPVDGRADQFAFSISLYQALFGRILARGADSSPELPALQPQPPRVTREIWQSLLKGMAADPSRRHASMDELLGKLTPARRPRRSRRLVGLGIAVVAVLSTVAAGALLLADDASRPARSCISAKKRLAGIWDDQARAAVVRQRAAAGSGGRDAAQRDTRALDDYATRWSTIHGTACGSAGRGELSEVTFALQMRCLDRRLDQFAERVRLLSTTGREGAATMRQLVVLTSLLEICGNATYVRQEQVPSDPGTARRVEALRRRMDEIELVMDPASAHHGTATSGQIVADAERIGFAPSLAQALEQHGRLLLIGGDAARSEPTLRRALKVAASVHDELLVARTAIHLVAAVGYAQGRLKEGMSLADFASAAVARVGPDDDLEISLDRNLGMLHYAAGRFRVARETWERALARARKRLPADDPLVLNLVTSLAAVQLSTGQYAAAVATAEDLLRVADQRDMDDTFLADAHSRLGLAYRFLGQYDVAHGHLLQALAIVERAFGADHLEAVPLLHWLAQVLVDLDRGEEALAAAWRSVRIAERGRAANPVEVINGLSAVALVLMDLRRYSKATALFENAIAQRIELQGADHPDLADDLLALGELHMRQGRYRDALARARHGRRLMSDADSERLPEADALLARIQLAQGRPGEALEAIDLSRDAELSDQGNVIEDGRRIALRGEILTTLGRGAEAEETLTGLMSRWEREASEKPDDVALTLAWRARARLGRGDLEAAASDAERANALLADDPRSAVAARAEARFALAEVWWASGGSRRTAAPSQARRARDEMRRRVAMTPYDPVATAARVAAIDRWLATRARLVSPFSGAGRARR